MRVLGLLIDVNPMRSESAQADQVAGSRND